MSEVIKNWITKCIGVVINMNPETFAEEVRDGTIIAQILQTYNIINEEQRSKINPSNNQTIAYKNLKCVRLWLQSIGVCCTEDEIFEISCGKCLSAVKLFYQIYLALHDKDELYYTAHKRGNERLHPTDTRFEIVAVNETTEQDFVSFTDSPYSQQLVLKNGVIQWNKSRYETLATTYEAMRERYSKYLQQKFGLKQKDRFENTAIMEVAPSCNLEDLNTAYPVDCKEYTLDELVEQEEKAQTCFEPDPSIACCILQNLKIKRKEQIKANELKVQKERLLLMELWNKLLTQQEKELEDCISTKILRQSVFEKQMSAKMFEVRQQKCNILQNRLRVDDEIKKKRDEDFLENVFLRDKCDCDQKYNFYFEKNRIMDLHKRIYAEKQRLIALRRKKMCSDIVDDLADLALKYHWYRDEYKMDPDRRVMKEWADLFIKSKSVFSFLDDASEVIVEDEVPEDMEEIYCAEIDRQEALDERDFEDYLNCEWPWCVEELLQESEDSLVQIDLGMNVLGHNVHRVLYAKYPSPQQPVPEFTSVCVAACVSGLPDVSILPALQKLLKHRRVKVIEMQDAINYCLKSFRDEIKVEEIDEGLKKETQETLKVLDKKKKKTVPKKGSKPKKNVTKVVEEPISPPNAEIGTQTPLIYPCQEIVLTRKAELGKAAYDLLNVGEELTDSLVVAMFVEYLNLFKDKDIRGWVLINYPLTFAQSVILEEALTGNQIPNVTDTIKIQMSVSIGDIADLEFREPSVDVEERNAGLRTSRLVPNPKKPPVDETYSTYLTAFINVKHASMMDKECEEDYVEPPLEEFYNEQGCSYSLYYEDFRMPQIKRLAKLILGEFAIPQKPSVELFGDTVLYLEAALTPPKPQEKPKAKTKTKTKEKSVSSEIKKRSAEAKKVSIEADFVVEEEVIQEEECSVVEEPPPPEPRAGEEMWCYIDLFIADHFEIGLATFWENLENVYVNDFKQLFFLKRLAFNAIVPYLTHVTNHMTLFLARPDYKQGYLSEFQKRYNDIDPEMRDDAEVKAEIHCTINEFREKLCEICDKRMTEAELERQSIVKDFWLVNQMIEILNICISAMQLELDRSCDSFQFITDYYCGVITKAPAKDPPLLKTTLNRIASDDSSDLYETFKNTTAVILIQVESPITNTPFHVVIQGNCETAQGILTKYKSTASAVIPKIEAYFRPKSVGKDLLSKKSSSKKTSTKKSSAKGSVKKETKQKERVEPEIMEPSEEVKNASEHLFEEWKCSVTGEYQRARIRLDMIRERTIKDIETVLSGCQKAFCNLFEDIHKRYQEEINSVNMACEVLARAVEAEVPIQPQLILDDVNFYVQPGILLFPDPPEPTPPPLEELKFKYVFTVKQLEQLVDILADLAPKGSISERSFMFVLQDLIVLNAEDGKESIVPECWPNLTPYQVSTLSKLIFGDVEFIDWRDFIIYNLRLPYPTIEQLLEVRTEFLEKDPDSNEVVHCCDFFDMKFWFEHNYDLNDPLCRCFTLDLVKNLLYRLYKVPDDMFNYTAFLLDFCKGETAVHGFTKALTLAFGKEICEDVLLGELYVANIKEQRCLDEQAELIRQLEREEALKCSASIISSLVNMAVHLCESVIIESIHSMEEEVEEPVPEVDVLQILNCDALKEHHDVTENEGSEEGEDLVNINSNDLEGDNISCDQFENVEIGFQPAYNKNYIYLLQFEPIFSVLTVSLPWHAKTQTVYDNSIRERLEIIYENLKDPMFCNHVLTHVLLHDEKFTELLSRFFKFVDKRPWKIVETLLECNPEES